MYDPDILRDAIATRTGEPISKLGYFCAPFRPEAGPLSDKVIKVYRALPDRAVLERMAQAHDAYADALRGAGVPLPETTFQLLDEDGGTRPVIVQEALEVADLMRPRMMAEGREDTLAMMEAAGEVIARFWLAVQDSETRIGFHPSIRNFAIVNGEAVFFDTFPPLIGYSREEMGRLLLLFSESPLMRCVGRVIQWRITAIQDEWYSPSETLVGLIGSACRLRPEFAEDYLDWGRDFASRRMAPWEAEITQGLDRPPRLPAIWTGFRKVLGLQGEPNV